MIFSLLVLLLVSIVGCSYFEETVSPDDSDLATRIVDYDEVNPAAMLASATNTDDFIRHLHFFIFATPRV